MRKTNVFVGPVTCKEVTGKTRVFAEVDNMPLWFESADIQLTPSAEAFASALLLPAVVRRLNLHFSDPLDATWLENSKEIQDVFCECWGFSPITLNAKEVNTHTSPQRNKTALLFTAGADSFFTLLTYPSDIDYLVFVEGYDLKLDEQKKERMNDIKLSLKAIADYKNARLIVIKTNLRDHSLARKKYKVTHPGALSSIGHLIPDVNKLLISSSHTYSYQKPVGSHWKIDPFFSSSILNIICFGAEYNRVEKLRRIAHESIVHKHLRVCIKPDIHTFNCGQCEKCIRTILSLLSCKQLKHFKHLNQPDNLTQAINHIPYASNYNRLEYHDLLKHDFDQTIKLAIEQLIKKSSRTHIRPLKKLLNILQRKLEVSL